MQQIVALAIVVLSGLYLTRSFWRSARAFFSRQGGCASGCGKCGFAPGGVRNPAATESVRRISVIPLAEVRSLPPKSENG